MKLDYIMIYEKSGLPIYANCFSGFCANLQIDETLLSGFLTALQTMPAILGNEKDSLQRIELKNIKLCFNATTPSGHIICMGVENKYFEKTSNEKLKELSDKISNFLETEYPNTIFGGLDKQERMEFEQKLLNSVLLPTLEYLRLRCACGEECGILNNDILMNYQQKIGSKKIHEIANRPVWNRLNELYEKKPNIIARLFLTLFIKWYIWKDNRIYEKNMTVNG